MGLGYIESAINDRDIAQRVADHKSRFFIEKDAQGNKIVSVRQRHLLARR
jgi:hypothetical protein